MTIRTKDTASRGRPSITPKLYGKREAVQPNVGPGGLGRGPSPSIGEDPTDVTLPPPAANRSANRN